MTNLFSLFTAAISSMPFAFIALMALPMCFGVIALGWVGSSYFNSVARNPSSSENLTNTLYVLIGVIEGSILACLGIGYTFVTGNPLINPDFSRIEQHQSFSVEKDTNKASKLKQENKEEIKEESTVSLD